MLITPISAYNVDTKTLAFADDIAKVTRDPIRGISAIEEEARKFGNASGYRLNEGKTQIVINNKINIIDPRISKQVTYLGVSITAKVENIVSNNMNPLIHCTKKDLMRLNNLHLTLGGRCNVIKMIFLPKFLYFFRSICLEFPPSLLKIIESMFSRFLWGYKNPRRAFRFTTLTKDRGGLAMPNFKIYYWATVLRYSTALFNLDPNMTLIPTPQELILGTGSQGCLWQHMNDSYFKKVKFKTISGIYKVWVNVQKLLGLGRYSYYTPVDKNNDLPDIFQDNYMERWIQLGITRLRCFYISTGLKTFEDLHKEFDLSHRDFFKYLQIRDFLLRKGGGRIKFQRVQTIENVCKKSIGEIYDSLNLYFLDDMDKQMNIWQAKLGVRPQVPIQAYDMSSTCLMSIKVQAQFYKTFFRLYYTPKKIAKWGTGRGTTCPRCTLYEADSVHMFATCTALDRVRKEISGFFSEIF